MKGVFRNTLISIVIIAGGAFVISYFISTDIPRSFFDARVQSAGAANNVAALINNSVANLKRIEEFEANQSYEQALDLVKYEIGQKQEKQNAAARLAGTLEQMANAALEISSGSARALAVDAVASGVAMVSRIVSYNAQMDQLFVVIQGKLTGGQQSAGGIRALLASINSDASAINKLSQEFNASLETFDDRYGTSPALTE